MSRTAAATNGSARPPSGVPAAVLVIGEVRQWTREGRALPSADRIVFAEPAEIDADLIGRVAPETVISSLILPDCDAVDIASALSRAGYRGAYRALTPALPDARIVQREVRRVAREIDFDLLIVDEAGRRPS